jgi:hypothetical protein
MEYLDNQLLLEVTIAEIFICFFFASIGFSLRELIIRREPDKRNNKKAFIESIVVIGFAVVISLMINPFIDDYSKRLVALPPFILGVIGMDFVKQLLSVNSLFNLITRAFKVFGLFQGREVKDDDEDKEDKKPKAEGDTCPPSSRRATYKENPFLIIDHDPYGDSIRKEDYSIDKYTVLHLLENSINNLDHEIEFIKSTYYRTHDHKSFLEMYVEIEKQYTTIRDITSSVDDVPLIISNKIVELVKKKIKLDEFYKSEVIASIHSEYGEE